MFQLLGCTRTQERVGRRGRSLEVREGWILTTYISFKIKYVSSAHDRLVNSDTYFATSNMTHKIQADTYVVGAYVLQIHMMPIKAACIYTTKQEFEFH